MQENPEMSETEVAKQVLPTDLVEALTLDVPSGSHDHVIDPGYVKTLLGGSHAHTFMLPDGNLVATDLGGAHSHDVWFYGGGFEAYGGIHAHKLSLTAGSEPTMTEDEGWHNHCWPEGGADHPTGQHRHVLMLDNGTVIQSLMPGDTLYELSREAAFASMVVDMYKSATYPTADHRYNVPGTISLCAKDGQAQLRFDFGYDGRDIALMVDIARKGVRLSEESLGTIRKGFGPNGTRYTVNLAAAPMSARLGKAEAPRNAATSVELEKCRIDYGYQSADTREFYVKADRIRGRVVVKTDCDGKVTATFTNDLTPELLSKAMRDEEFDVPPLFASGMPSTLALTVPMEHLFWQETDKAKAAEKIKALAKSGVFAGDNVAWVAGEVRAVETAKVLRKAGAAPTAKASAGTVVTRVKRAGQPGLWGPLTDPSCDATHIALKGASSIPADELGELVGKFASLDRGYLIETEDTQETRSMFASLGPMFKVRGGESLFVASFDPGLDAAASIEVIDPVIKLTSAEVMKRLEGGEDPGFRRMYVAKDAGGTELRMAMGVVLEPDEVDAQNDTISAETIRKAAHGFMAHYQNMGLQHKMLANDKVQLLESYIAPVDMEVNGDRIKAGSWVMATKYNDDELWAAVKAGGFTGYSIGGFAKRRPLQS